MPLKNPVIVSIDFDFFVREPVILDWGHSEAMSPELLEMIWAARRFGMTPKATQALVPESGPRPVEFWGALEGLGFSLVDALAFFSDSHEVGGRQIFECLDKTMRYDLFHFDAHHDLGYRESPEGILLGSSKWPSCEDWLIQYALKSRRIDTVNVVYPEWRREPCPLSGIPAAEVSSVVELGEQVKALERVGTSLDVLFWEDLEPEPCTVEFICVARSPAWVPPWFDDEYAVLLDECPGYELHHSFGPHEDLIFQPRQMNVCRL